MGVFPGKFLVSLYLVIPLVTIPETLLIEVEGYASGVIGGGLHHGLELMEALTGGALLVS